mmetsp:Transcript_18200/g.52698  ORF Transcript_18200/g.52698 Transcript_18200/m.52698 type:complete len:336 (-) Transcript_18200:33-1040(-)
MAASRAVGTHGRGARGSCHEAPLGRRGGDQRGAGGGDDARRRGAGALLSRRRPPRFWRESRRHGAAPDRHAGRLSSPRRSARPPLRREPPRCPRQGDGTGGEAAGGGAKGRSHDRALALAPIRCRRAGRLAARPAAWRARPRRRRGRGAAALWRGRRRLRLAAVAARAAGRGRRRQVDLWRFRVDRPRGAAARARRAQGSPRRHPHQRVRFRDGGAGVRPFLPRLSRRGRRGRLQARLAREGGGIALGPADGAWTCGRRRWALLWRDGDGGRSGGGARALVSCEPTSTVEPQRRRQAPAPAVNERRAGEGAVRVQVLAEELRNYYAYVCTLCIQS